MSSYSTSDGTISPDKIKLVTPEEAKKAREARRKKQQQQNTKQQSTQQQKRQKQPKAKPKSPSSKTPPPAKTNNRTVVANLDKFIVALDKKESVGFVTVSGESGAPFIPSVFIDDREKIRLVIGWGSFNTNIKSISNISVKFNDKESAKSLTIKKGETSVVVFKDKKISDIKKYKITITAKYVSKNNNNIVNYTANYSQNSFYNKIADFYYEMYPKPNSKNLNIKVKIKEDEQLQLSWDKPKRNEGGSKSGDFDKIVISFQSENINDGEWTNFETESWGTSDEKYDVYIENKWLWTSTLLTPDYLFGSANNREELKAQVTYFLNRGKKKYYEGYNIWDSGDNYCISNSVKILLQFIGGDWSATIVK